MSEFKIIETQEAFDAAIADRLARDRKKYAAQFEEEMRAKGWKTTEEVEALTADLAKQVEALQTAAASTEQKMAEKDALIAAGNKHRDELEKIRIAVGMGLGIEAAGRIRGETPEEWKADAQKLMDEMRTFAAGRNAPPPMGSTESAGTKDTRTQFAEWAAEALIH